MTKMQRWSPVAFMAVLACATAIDPVGAQDGTFDQEQPEYDRKDWKHWSDADKDCQDSRQEVLIRDSDIPVTFTDEKQCRVATGQWTCPYTGTVITDSSKVDVDHMVALNDAHGSGGWSWSADQRESFANDLDNPKHLLATSQYGNRSKGAKGPDEWLPPLESARCQYIQDWMLVKANYELVMDEGESAVLLYMIHICDEGLTPPMPQ